MKADESKRKQAVDQQLQLREQLLKTGEVQRQLMALQEHLNGENKTVKEPTGSYSLCNLSCRCYSGMTQPWRH